MTQGEYSYPPDEFDAVDPSDGPRGVHRRPRSRWATLWPYLAALVVSALLGVLLIGVLWDRGAVPSALPLPGAGAGTEDAAVEPSPSPTPTATTEPEAPAAQEPTPVPPAPQDPTPEPPAPAPDRTTRVDVLNSTSLQGLAADAAERLEDAGWTRVEPGNFAGGTLARSTVRYGAADLEVSARAVADVLGIATVQAATGDVEGIQVVLERDFAD